MVIYTVQEPGDPAQTIEERADGVVFIKEGFTWWGFLFGPFWMLFNRLWFELIGVLMAAGCFAALLGQYGMKDQAPTLVNTLLMLFIGFEGNDLRRWRLDRKGYSFLASVAGRTLEECERRFFDAWLPHVASRMARPLNPSADPRQSPPAGGDWRGPSALGTLPGAI
jgi:hypothetical protein